MALNGSRMRTRAARRAARRLVPLERDRDPFDEIELREDVRRLLLDLAPRQRAALLLLDMYGYGSEEAARIMSRSEPQGRGARDRGRRRRHRGVLRGEGKHQRSWSGPEHRAGRQPLPTEPPFGPMIVGTDGTVFERISGLPDDASGLQMSPLGDAVAFMTDGRVATIRLDGTGLRILTDARATAPATRTRLSPGHRTESRSGMWRTTTST